MSRLDMQIITLEALQQDFERYFDLVIETDEPLLIQCPDGDEVVMVSERRYREMMEVLSGRLSEDSPRLPSS